MLSLNNTSKIDYFNVFNNMLLLDDEFNDKVNKLTNGSLKSNDEKYIKFSSKFPDDNFYKMHLFNNNELKAITELLNFIYMKLMNDDDYIDLKNYYTEKQRGGCAIMGAKIWAFGQPNNIRCKAPIKYELFSFGYLNGELEKELILTTLNKLLNKNKIDVLEDMGHMD